MNIRLTTIGRHIALCVALIFGCTSLWGQGNSNLKINEVMVTNTSNLVDEYGNRSAWVELYNPSAATINVGGMFLTDDTIDTTKYPIRVGRNVTKIAPYQTLVFFLDGMPQHGTLHSGLTLNPDYQNTIYLYDGDGKGLIDMVTIPKGIPANKTYARLDDDGDEWGIAEQATPNELNNYTLDKAARIAEFKDRDPAGVGMTLIAVIVVFLGLIILFLVFKQMGKLHTNRNKKRISESTGIPITQVANDVTSKDVYAAIGLALSETLSTQHDIEDNVITINETKRRYSPWSSKIYTLRQLPERR